MLKAQRLIICGLFPQGAHILVQEMIQGVSARISMFRVCGHPEDEHPTLPPRGGQNAFSEDMRSKLSPPEDQVSHIQGGKVEEPAWAEAQREEKMWCV